MRLENEADYLFIPYHLFSNLHAGLMLENGSNFFSILYHLFSNLQKGGLFLMNKTRIITIGRRFGSGGREIGRCVAQKLGIGFYDKEIITEAAKKKRSVR